MAEDVVTNIGDGLKSLYRSVSEGPFHFRFSIFLFFESSETDSSSVQARNVASGATDTEIKVREATNNDKCK